MTPDPTPLQIADGLKLARENHFWDCKCDRCLWYEQFIEPWESALRSSAIPPVVEMQARHNHDWALTQEHAFGHLGAFEDCPYPNCAALRGSAEPRPASPMIEALRASAELLRAYLPCGHDGDEETGTHFDDCSLCAYLAVLHQIDEALDGAPPASRPEQE